MNKGTIKNAISKRKISISIIIILLILVGVLFIQKMEILEILEKISNILLPIFIFIFGLLIFSKQKNIESKITRKSNFITKVADEFFTYSKLYNEKINLYLNLFQKFTFESNKNEKDKIIVELKELIWNEIQFTKRMIITYSSGFLSSENTYYNHQNNLIKEISNEINQLFKLCDASNYNLNEKEEIEKARKKVETCFSEIHNKLCEFNKISSIIYKQLLEIK